MHPKRVYAGLQFIWGVAGCLTATVYAPYLLSLGLSMADIAFINAVFWIVISVAELPTGMFADVIGRTWSIRVGAILLAVAQLSYAFARGKWSALVIEFVAGMAVAFVSGADKAWLVDALRKHDGDDAALDRVLGYGQRFSALGCLIGGVAGSWIGRFSFRTVYLCEASFGAVVACYVWIFLREDRQPSADDAGHVCSFRHRIASGKSKFVDSGRALAASADLRWVVVSTMALALVMPINLAWGAYFRDRFGASGTAMVWAAFIIAGGLSGEWIHRRGVRSGHEAGPICFSLVLIGSGVMLISLRLPLEYIVVAALIEDAGLGASRCLTDLFVQRRIESAWRATYGSLHSLFSRLANGAVLVVWWFWSRGRADDPRFIVQVWVACGLLLVTCASLLYLFRPKPSPALAVV